MLFSSNYFPCIAYFSEILLSEKIEIPSNQTYKKQSYQTRAYILGPHQVETLTVPVSRYKNNTVLADIEISYATNWIEQHLKTLRNCYNKSPYFQLTISYFEEILNKKHIRLMDLNTEILQLCLKIMCIDKTICHIEASTFDLINNILYFNCKNRVEFANNFQPKTYFQNFGKNFEPNLSVLDLIFNKGKDAVLIINPSFGK
jgi:hypothetical protein